MSLIALAAIGSHILLEKISHIQVVSKRQRHPCYECSLSLSSVRKLIVMRQSLTRIRTLVCKGSFRVRTKSR